MGWGMDVLEKYQDEEAAKIVLMHAADHLYNRSRWEDGDEQAIDLLDGIRADMQEAAEK